MGRLYNYATQDLRTLIGVIGVGDTDANLIIPYLWMAPATTDLDSPHTIVLIRAIQRQLKTLGAPNINVTGEMDLPTAAALQRVAGAGWMSTPWSQLVQALVAAVDQRVSLAPAPQPRVTGVAGKPGLGGIALPDISGLVPGGNLGLAALAAGAYYVFVHKKRRAR